MKYKTAIYIRLSKEDDNKKEQESNSIINQRSILNDYVTKNDNEFDLVDTYVDENYSGTNFERPGFKRMMEDARDKKINCIIVKDLSRFGRDYIEVGSYIEKIFPLLKVRFIALNEYDSKEKKNDIVVPFKNLMNAEYSKEISKKIISTFRNKQSNGQFIGAFASYGYLKDNDNKNKLVIDEYAAQIVKRIFSMYLSGKGKISIATILNNEGILCPSEYKKSIGLKYTNSNILSNTSYWTYSTIQNILKNEIYVGNMVQHKSNISKFNKYEDKIVNKNDWIRVLNTHEPIIDMATWETTQDLLKRNTRVLDFNNNVSVFAGYLVCGDCGRAMSKIVNNGVFRYVCGSYKRYSKNTCTSHSVKEVELEQHVLDKINSILSKINNLTAIIEDREKNYNYKIKQTKQKELNNIQIDKAKKEIEKILKFKKGLYENLVLENINQDDFNNYKTEYEEKEKHYKDIIDSLISNSISEEENLIQNSFVQKLKSTKKIETVNRELLEQFFEKIVIYEDHIELRYKFKDIITQIKNL